MTHENIGLITGLLKRTLPDMRKRYTAKTEVSDADRATYIAICLYYLYDSYDTQLQELIKGSVREAPFAPRAPGAGEPDELGQSNLPREAVRGKIFAWPFKP